MPYSMMSKSELKITHIRLTDANLNDIAECVARVVGADPDRVLVIDVRNGEVALDVLDDAVDPHAFMGKQRELLAELAELPGVFLEPESRVTSDGMLGWIAFDADQSEVDETLNRANDIVAELNERIARRAMVFPSGAEVIAGEIEDTNTPLLIHLLSQAGFDARAGETIPDDLDVATGCLRHAITQGFGAVITTGGVGAEDKDHSIEAICALDPDAATPYIVKFKPGHGRHLKDGIRIGVGNLGGVYLIALPGPNDEVSLVAPTVVRGLLERWPKDVLARQIADALRVRLEEKCAHGHRLERVVG